MTVCTCVSLYNYTEMLQNIITYVAVLRCWCMFLTCTLVNIYNITQERFECSVLLYTVHILPNNLLSFSISIVTTEKAPLDACGMAQATGSQTHSQDEQ
jgi:hypothetical protein